MAKELIIQLGFPKTGTTTLQNRIYHHHPEYLYLGKHNRNLYPDAEKRDAWILKFKRDLIAKDYPYFEKFRLDKVLLERFGEEYEAHEKLFLSEESILGRCINPGKYGKLIRVGSAHGIIDKLKLLYKSNSFSAIKLVVVIRKQDDLIESFFAEEYQNFQMYYGMKKPEEFVDYLFNKAEMEETDAVLRYHSLIANMDDTFGKDNILILPYEMLKEHPEMFLNEFSTFMGIQPWKDIRLVAHARDNSRDVANRPGKIAKQYPLRQKLSFIKQQIIGDIPTGLAGALSFIDRLQPNKYVQMNEVYREKIMDHYAKSNRKLEGRVKDISEYEYY